MLNSIQYLRGIAALLVVYLHTTANGLFGHQGVDIFFVISGFIMAYIMDVRPRNFKDFLSARLIRVVPFYYVITLIALALGLYESNLDFTNIMASFLFIANEPIVYQGWTLTYELIFYFLCAFAILILKNNIHRVIFISSILLIVGLPDIRTDGLYVEFFFGIVAFYIWKNVSLNKKHIKILASVLLTISFVTFYIYDFIFESAMKDFPFRALFYGIPAMFIVLSLLFIEKMGSLPVSKLLQKIGNSSYSLYLTHGGVMMLLYNWSNLAKDENLYFDWLLVAISIIIGWYCYIFIEKPLLKYITLKKINTTYNYLSLKIQLIYNK